MIDRQIELCCSRNVAQHRGIVGLPPKRAEVILVDARIVRTVMGKLRQRTVRAGDRGCGMARSPRDSALDPADR